MRLKYEDLYFANDENYVNAHPGLKNELIKMFKDNPPRECISCVAFKWIRDDDQRIIKWRCSLKKEIGSEKYESEKRARGCPFD